MNIEAKEFQTQLAGAADRLDLWLRILQLFEVRRMAEVGVWKGDFASELLRRRPELERYVMIYPWARLPDWNKPFNVEPEMFDAVHGEAMAKTAFAADRIEVLRGTTKAMAERIADASLDLVYIDGDHTLRGITIDLIRLLPKVRDGGLIGGDDFFANPWQHDRRFEPTLVCPFAVYFAEAMDLPLLALPGGQFVMQKRTGAGFRFVDTTGGYADLGLNKLPPRRWGARALLRRLGIG